MPLKLIKKIATGRGLYLCSCGKKIITCIYDVTRKHTTSCGCSRKTHGFKNHPLYQTFIDIKRRCYNKTRDSYNSYGGRGIKVEPWLQKVENFIPYVVSLPKYSLREKHNLTLDRINNDKGYTRGNLRWATKAEQGANRRKKGKN